MKIEKIDKWLDDKYGISYTELVKIKDYLVDENERIRNKIDKVDKYIKENKTNTYQTLNFENGETYNTALLDLLDLLRGDDNE